MCIRDSFVAAAVAAVKDHPCPLVIVSLGTATTLTAVDGAGCLLGTAIMPGVQLSQEALREEAACLPEVDMQAPESVVGTNTVDAMRSGLIYGTASMLEMCIRDRGKGALMVPVPLHQRQGHLFF